MEFLIFSDSHGSAQTMSAAIDRQIKMPDAVLFLGDGARDLDRLFLCDIPIWAVRGNCDWSSSDYADKTERLLYFEGHTILLCHGHEWGVKGGMGALIAHAAEVGADIVLFGHTHTPTVKAIAAGEQVKGTTLTRPMYLFNPGSIGYEGSFGTLTLKGESVLLSHGKL
jgi:putative phosphoesterase